MRLSPLRTRNNLEDSLDMWKGRAEKLAPLTALTSEKATWKWTEVEQQAFEAIKTTVAKNTLLVYPDFNE
eukprot:14145335-Ditylum_brightwellii.AAC.1